MNKISSAEAIEFQTGFSLIRVYHLLSLDFLQNPKNINSDFYKSVFTECIIELNFLLHRDDFKEIIEKVRFKDDIPEYKWRKDGYSDIVTLITFCRNAVCHSEASPKRLTESGQYISFSFQAGLNSTEPDSDHLCKFEDDIACVFGSHILYIKRHMVRVFNELLEGALELDAYNVYKSHLAQPGK